MAQAIYGLNMSVDQGKIIESYEVPAGQTEGSFSWKVASTGDANDDAQNVVDAIIARPQRAA